MAREEKEGGGSHLLHGTSVCEGEEMEERSSNTRDRLPVGTPGVDAALRGDYEAIM